MVGWNEALKQSRVAVGNRRKHFTEEGRRFIVKVNLVQAHILCSNKTHTLTVTVNITIMSTSVTTIAKIQLHWKISVDRSPLKSALVMSAEARENVSYSCFHFDILPRFLSATFPVTRLLCSHSSKMLQTTSPT